MLESRKQTKSKTTMLKPTTDIQLLGTNERQKTEQLEAKDQPIDE